MSDLIIFDPTPTAIVDALATLRTKTYTVSFGGVVVPFSEVCKAFAVASGEVDKAVASSIGTALNTLQAKSYHVTFGGAIVSYSDVETLFTQIR